MRVRKNAVILSAIVLALFSTVVMADSIDYIPNTTAVTVDGVGSDLAWQGQEWINLDPPESLMMGDPQEVSNCGLKMKFGHDATNLYLLAEVTDDRTVTGTWTEWWKSDKVIIGCSPTPGPRRAINASDRLILIQPSTSDNLRVVRLSTDSLVNVGCCAVVTRSGGWTTECAIPLTELGTFCPDAEIGFVALFWDIDPGNFMPNVVGSYQNAPMVVDGPIAFSRTTWSSWTVSAKEVESANFKQAPDNLPLEAKSLGWTVTKVVDNGFCCQDPYNRINGAKVIGSTAGVAEGNVIWGLTGVFSTVGPERIFSATNVDLIPVEAKLPAPFNLNSIALGGGMIGGGAPNFALRVQLSGKIKEVASDYFVIHDGRDVKVAGVCPFLPGTSVTVTGVSSSEANAPVILMNDIREVQ